MKKKDWRLKNFKKKEFRCKCGCGFCVVNSQLLYKLDTLRTLSQKPIIITSGCRCRNYNETLQNSVSNSSHCTGNAVDIAIHDSLYRYQIIKLAIELEFLQIGIAKNFIHLGVDISKSKNIIFTY